MEFWAKTRGGVNFVQALDALGHVVGDGRERGHDGGGPEPVGDHGEVGEVPLDAGLEDGLRVGVTQRWPVLVEELHELLADIPAIKQICLQEM